MAATEQLKNSDAEVWKTFPFETQVEIDMAIENGMKVEAINRTMCAGKFVKLQSAVNFIERRVAEFRKHRISTKN